MLTFISRNLSNCFKIICKIKTMWKVCKNITNFRRFFVAFRSMTTSSNTTFNNILTEKYGGIMTIAINRPEKRNAVNQETAKELFQAFTDFEQDSESLVAVLHGKGGNFCAGYDLSALADADDSSRWQEQLPDGQGPMGPSRMFISKPVIACIDGYAVAGGLELALLCDLRVVEESAILGVFCRRFGIPLIDGGTVRLQKLIGLSRAMDLILTGRSVTGKEAFDIGLANRIANVGSGLSEALQLAHSLLKFPQKCMNTDRQSAYYAAYGASSQEDALRYEHENGIKVLVEESIPGAKNLRKVLADTDHSNQNCDTRKKLDVSLVCRVCGNVFKRTSGLKIHKRRHEGVGIYTLCEKRFFSKESMTRHM